MRNGSMNYCGIITHDAILRQPFSCVAGIVFFVCLFVCLGADPNILFDTLGTNSISDENVNISRHSTTGI